MSTEPESVSYHPPIIEFKSCSLTIPVLVLRGNDQHVIATQLQAKIEEAPAFFKDSPVIFDLNAIRTKNLDLDLSAVTETARSLQLVPIGIRGGSEQHKETARQLQLAAFSDFGFNVAAARRQPQKIQIETEPQPPAKETRETKIITQPIRSGQRIYATGDLIVTSQVGAGSEIMAEGNIHVYGILRGRALAGVKGDTECRIFCSQLEAELISIAGIYKTCDDLDSSLKDIPIQISLQNQALLINTL